MVYRYESTEGYAKEVGVLKGTPHANSFNGGWTNYQTFAQSVDKAIRGDDSLVAEAEKLLDQLDASVEVPTKSWEPNVHGAYPVVPDYLSGSPTPMRALSPVYREESPISIYVSTTCSAGVDADTMQKRGVAIMALLLKMQQIRPIELYLLAETHGSRDGECLQVIKVESKPLNLATACYAVADVAFARNLTYSQARKLEDFNGCWPDGYNMGGAKWEAHVREVLGMGEHDLYVGAARLWDEMVQHPVEWINATIARFQSEGGENEKDY